MKISTKQCETNSKDMQKNKIDAWGEEASKAYLSSPSS
jgi:hypothetical protein